MKKYLACAMLALPLWAATIYDSTLDKVSGVWEATGRRKA